MRRLGYRWRSAELTYAVRYWGTIVLVYAFLVFALVLVAYRWPW